MALATTSSDPPCDSQALQARDSEPQVGEPAALLRVCVRLKALGKYPDLGISAEPTPIAPAHRNCASCDRGIAKTALSVGVRRRDAPAPTTRGPWPRFENGTIIPPAGPGLGVELDEDVVAAHPFEP